MPFSFSSSEKIKQMFISWKLWSEKGQNFPPGARWLERDGRGKYLLNLSMSSYSIFLINIYLDIMWGETCSDHSNVGDCTVILLMPASGREGGKKEKQRKRESVREFTSNLEKVMGFCVDLAEDRMPWESQCISRPRGRAKRLKSSAFHADTQGTGVASREKMISL